MHMPQEGLFSRACYLAGTFAQRQGESGKPTGLLLIAGYQPSLSEYTHHMGDPLLNGHTNLCLGTLPADEVYGLFEELAQEDGALAIDLDGRLVAAPVYVSCPPHLKIDLETEQHVEHIKGKYVERPRMGARHQTAARWSQLGTYNFAVAVSGDAGTSIPFVRGKVVKPYVWEPGTEAPHHVDVYSPASLPPSGTGEAAPPAGGPFAWLKKKAGEWLIDPRTLWPEAYC